MVSNGAILLEEFSIQPNVKAEALCDIRDVAVLISYYVLLLFAVKLVLGWLHLFKEVKNLQKPDE